MRITIQYNVFYSLQMEKEEIEEPKILNIQLVCLISSTLIKNNLAKMFC